MILVLQQIQGSAVLKTMVLTPRFIRKMLQHLNGAFLINRINRDPAQKKKKNALLVEQTNGFVIIGILEK